MANVKFVKNPGYLSDLLFIFMYKFNKEYCLKNFLNFDKAGEDTEFYNKIDYEFSDVPDDLCVFFYMRDDKRSFFCNQYIFDHIDGNPNEYTIETMQKMVADKDAFFKDFVAFYFSDIKEEDIEKCKSDMRLISEYIENSKYSDYLKRKLYCFFINPEKIMQKLAFELIAKEMELSKYYEKNYQKLIEKQSNFDFDKLAKRLKTFYEQNFFIDENNEIYISFCLVRKNGIAIHFKENTNLLVMGYDFESHLSFLENRDVLPTLDVLGTVLAEKNRLSILDLLLEKDEITLKEVETTFKISTTNAYYHLSLMVNANVLNIRNQGRTIMYSLNRRYFDKLAEVLKKYGNNK